jgi:carboxymethylenebutenolidase
MITSHGVLGHQAVHDAVDELVDDRLRATLDREAKVAHEIVRYPGAEHGFHCDRRASYQEAAATDGWTRTLEWLRRHLGR